MHSSGGPNFYINTNDNTQIHGPGGQPPEDDIIAEAAAQAGTAVSRPEPCFGRVVSGYDVIQRLQQQPLVGGRLANFVTILDVIFVRYAKPHMPPEVANINRRSAL